MRKLFICVLMMVVSMNVLAQHQSPAVSPAPEIFLLGTAHNLHFDPESHYSLADLREEVAALHPDLICGEITPEAYQGPMEGYFPPEAAYLAEVAASIHAHFAPTDWRIARAWQSRAEGMEPKEVKDKVEALTQDASKQMHSHSDPSLFDFLHTTGVTIADYQFEQLTGENTVSDIAMGAWHERNRRIVENCLDAAGSDFHRIVIAFGAGHIPTLRRQLAARGITAQIASRLFVPAGLAIMPAPVIARWQRNLENLRRILDGSVAVTRDSLDKVKESHRIQDLEQALKIYASETK